MKRLLLLGLAACFPHGPSDQGITSNIHRTHVGGMVFASAEIQRGAENPATFVDHCVLGDPCYGRFYLPSSLRASAHDDWSSGIALHATVDGTPMPDGVFVMERWWSTYKFTLFRAPTDNQPWEHPKWFLEKVASRLPPGDHVIDLAVLAVPHGTGAGAGAPIASGRITFTVPPNARTIIARALPRENRLLAEAQAAQQAQQAEWERQAAASAASSSSSSESAATPSEPPPTETEAPKPSGPSCKPDGAETDDWNKCCDRHWRMTPDGFSHRCCNTETYHNKGDVRTDCS